MIKLRPYQEEALDLITKDLKDYPSALAVMPCGAGKTEIMISLIQAQMKIKDDLRCVVLLNRLQLLDQTEKRFIKVIDKERVGIFCGGRNKRDHFKNVTVASIQSISDIDSLYFDIVIVDEVHNIDERGGRYADFISHLRHVNPHVKVVGFTATPFRNNGEIFGNGKLFPKISCKKSLKSMIEEGYLVRPRLRKVDHQFDISGLRIRMGEYNQKDVDELVSDEGKVREQVKDALSRMSDRNCIVWACASIEHAENVCAYLRINTEAAHVLHSKLEDHYREYVLREFQAGKVRHLVFVSIVSEGFDHPPIDCVVLMRPIRSPVLYVQVSGRALRLSPKTGKKDMLLLDYGKVVETLGPLDDPRISKGAKKKGEKLILLMKFCPQCLDYIQINATECAGCGYLFPKPDPVKSLTHRPSENVDILSPDKPKEKKEIYHHTVKNIKVSLYNGISGRCLLIRYFINDFLLDHIKEYFPCYLVWGVNAGNKRLKQFGMSLKDVMDGHSVTSLPKSIEFSFKGKYPRIKRIHFQ